MENSAARTFKDLIVWQKAHQFVLQIYRFTSGFPSNEMYGLVSQMRRCAVSVRANIAEGFKRRGKPDKVRFMNIAQGSLEECKYYLILVNDLHYGETEILDTMIDEVSRLLEVYSNAIRKSF